MKSGGRSRLSTFSAGIFLLVMILVFGDLVAMIPMAALVAVMIVVAVATFDYDDDVERVVIDLTDAHVRDSSAVATLDAVVHKFEARGVEVELIGLNDHSHELHNGLTGRLVNGH